MKKLGSNNMQQRSDNKILVFLQDGQLNAVMSQ